MEEFLKTYVIIENSFKMCDQELLKMFSIFKVLCDIFCDSEFFYKLNILNHVLLHQNPVCTCSEDLPLVLKDYFYNSVILIAILTLLFIIVSAIIIIICFYVAVQKIGFCKSIGVFLIAALLFSIILPTFLYTLGLIIYYVGYGLKCFLENAAIGFGSIFDFTVRRISTYHCYHEGGCFF